jgi:hypothetical protein
MRRDPITVPVIATILALSGAAHAQFAAPEAVVRSLYAFYGSGQNDLSGFPQDNGTLRKFLVPALVKLWSAATIDADFFIQGQDFALSDMTISPTVTKGDQAAVAVAFKNMGEPVRLTYELASAKDGWRISDVRAADGSTLRQFLKSSRR